MDHKAYNRKLVEHLFDLFETAQGERWHMAFDLSVIEHKQGLERYVQPDGTLVLNFHPVACRNFHIGAEHLTFNMSLGGTKQHLILPHYAVRGIMLELEEGTIGIPACPVMIQEQGFHTPTEPDQPKEGDGVVNADTNVISMFNRKAPTKE